MQKIVPHLWFDKEAKEAAEFYTAAFANGSKINSAMTLHDTPSGDCDIVSFELSGYEFKAISAGPLFTFNPAISFMLNFDPARDKDARKNLDALWEKLSEGGKVLMALDTYPFSERYGWIEDKYGVSWQLILTNPKGEERPFIVPTMLFVKKMYGKAEEAVNFYLSVFKDSRLGTLIRYPKDAEHAKEGTIMYSDVVLERQWFAAMDGPGTHEFAFNEAISFIINCKDQKEIDYYWEKLSAVPDFEQCGWLKDKFGISWQIVPLEMDDMMKNGTEAQIARLTKAFLQMKKFDVAALKKAYEGHDA
jgi:predicted 3-demethylubiquinone-9 3-methyltransferase (glyoxalase superfamily)